MIIHHTYRHECEFRLVNFRNTTRNQLVHYPENINTQSYEMHLETMMTVECTVYIVHVTKLLNRTIESNVHYLRIFHKIIRLYW